LVQLARLALQRGVGDRRGQGEGEQRQQHKR
jgi:hypothetical protein